MGKILDDSKPLECVWLQGHNPYRPWTTSCGKEFQFHEGGPNDNEMQFCCFCGKRLKEEKWRK